jgi:hypothetical protein
MLAKTPSCVECGLVLGASAFRHEDQSPLYWSDTGILCSVSCATKHFDRRRADGTFVAAPAECPVEI